MIAARRKVHKTTGEEVAARWTFEEGVSIPYILLYIKLIYQLYLRVMYLTCIVLWLHVTTHRLNQILIDDIKMELLGESFVSMARHRVKFLLCAVVGFITGKIIVTITNTL